METKDMTTTEKPIPIIEIKGIGKRYNITHQQGGYVTLRDIFANILRNPFKFAKHKAKQIVGFAAKEDFWALKDISFNVRRREIIGIIGRNGAGKSTLLKILTGITPPTEGEIIMRGRVASLLEVGTGFHPELTGRENVFLNGAILGMTRKEIARKFDEIVAFSGVEKFLDTPVKRYSSGMYVRLAFSVAVHMEPDILLIDEVLAVGDSEFQKKCIGKMEEVTEKSGRTILFVSHNIDAVERLCSKTVWIDQGTVKMIGETKEVISQYLEHSRSPAVIQPHKISPELKLHKIISKNKNDEPWDFHYQQDIELEVMFESFIDIRNFQLGIGINMISLERIATVHNEERFLAKGNHTISIKIQNPFAPGTYGLTLDVLSGFGFHLPDFATIRITSNEASEKIHKQYNPGVLDLAASFSFI
jgi:lipopolysaccharide transport system ATP-binding protein